MIIEFHLPMPCSIHYDRHALIECFEDGISKSELEKIIRIGARSKKIIPQRDGSIKYKKKFRKMTAICIQYPCNIHVKTSWR